MLASIAWADQFVHQAKDVSLMVANFQDMPANTTLIGALPRGWLEQSGHNVFSAVEQEVARMCWYNSPVHCPPHLRLILEEKTPRRFETAEGTSIGLSVVGDDGGNQRHLPCEHSAWPACWGVWWMPVKTTLIIFFVFPVFVSLTVNVFINYIWHGCLQQGRGATERNFLLSDKVRFCTDKEYLFACICALSAAIQVQMRKVPHLDVDTDRNSPTLNLLLSYDYPSECSNGFNEDSGLTKLGAILGFLIVSRYVTLYNRRVACRAMLTNMTTALRNVAVHLVGLIHGAPSNEHYAFSKSEPEPDTEVVAPVVTSQLRKEFDHYDKNNDGKLDETEVIAMLVDLGYCNTQSRFHIAIVPARCFHGTTP
jgi:hypothetical protein